MWYFRAKTPGEKIRNPIQGEFFATDAIDGPAQALVRESNQNSLDAVLGKESVKVRLTLRDGSSALAADQVSQLFGAAWPHYAATGNGLHDPPLPTSPCPYLLIEDYGTRGLTGDPSQPDPDPDPTVKNSFFLFFRAEGLSAKTGTELGRWGVGKFVFPRSSLASTHFGVTVRHDDRRRLLLGAVTLKAHRVEGDATMYTPDGLYGEPDENGFVMPIEEQSAIDNFCSLFGVTRTTEPGLSVVVPFVDSSITFDALIQASVRDYFLPVMHDDLEITIISGDKHVTLNGETLDDVLSTHMSTLGPAVKSQVELARSSLHIDPAARIVIQEPNPRRAPRWQDVEIDDAQVTSIRDRLKAGETVAIRVPVFVRTKKGETLPSYFDVYLRADDNSDGRPLFIREGIIISDVRGRRAREISSLVMIEDKALASMLGDSENPAHTQWQKDSSNFAGKYTAGKSVIDYVTDSVGELLAIVNRSNEEADPSLTIDYFSFDPPDEEEDTEDSSTKKPRPLQGQENQPPIINVVPKPSRVKLSRIDGGFALANGTAPPPPPFLLEVRCAYDVRSGNPLKKWDAADFTLGPGGLPVACMGAISVLQSKNNAMLLRVDGPEFRAKVDGFDNTRDVFVRYEIREVGSASQET